MEYKFICGRHQCKEKEPHALECCQLKKKDDSKEQNKKLADAIYTIDVLWPYIQNAKIDDVSIETFANWVAEYATTHGLNKQYITNGNLLRWYKIILWKWQKEETVKYIRDKINKANKITNSKNVAKDALVNSLFIYYFILFIAYDYILNENAGPVSTNGLEENLSHCSESSSIIVSGDSSLQDHQEASEIFNFAGFKDTKIDNNPIIDLILQHNLNCVAHNDPIRSGHLFATFPHPLLYNKNPDKFDAIINRNDRQFGKLAHPLSRKMAEWFFEIYKRSNFTSHHFERPEFLTSKEGHLAVQIASTIQLSVNHYQKTGMNSQSVNSEATWENGEICKIKPDGTIYFVIPEMHFPIGFLEGQKPYLPNATKKSQTDAEKLQREIKLAHDSLLRDIQSKYSARISKEVAKKIFEIPFITSQITGEYFESLHLLLNNLSTECFFVGSEAIISVSNRTLHPILTTWELCRFRIDFHKLERINDIQKIFSGIFVLQELFEKINTSWNELFIFLADAPQLLPKKRYNLSTGIIPFYHYALGEYDSLEYDYQLSQNR
ncbi:5832_t:CDS:2 [Cetraspora pellucida]|uniref:5832_t:CDS:1 n=1 Tax=Cetraspora pellucida TaxID=1433469 RepID=A0A9N8YVL1_9GLOM|nr:5832_t:CDS:2 [Cetraspora pellucida]